MAGWMASETMRPFLLVLVVFATVFSGCVEDGPSTLVDSTDSAPPPPPDVLPWGLEDCRYVVAWGWVDPAAVIPYLPDGFTVRTSSGVGALPRTEAVLFGADAMVCASGTGLNGTVEPMHWGYVWAAADPPAEYLQENVSAGEHYVKWDVLVPDADRRAVLVEKGVPAHDGSAAVTDTPFGPDATTTLAGIGTIRIQALDARPTGAFEGDFVKFTSSDKGVVAWRAHAGSGPRVTGDALLTFPEGSWMADVVGGTTLRGGHHSGTWTYDDARLVFLAGA